MQFRSRTLLAVAALSIGLSAASNANAMLVSVQGGQIINDTGFNISWLADANYAKSSGYDADGLMDWYQAKNWIASLNAENGGAGHLGYNDWRLPATLQPDVSCGSQSGGVFSGLNCVGSEMGHLFYSELGGVAGSSITATHNANYGLFGNVQSSFYWSDTESPPSAGSAWLFSLGYGGQVSGFSKGNKLYALAVRSGQVTADPMVAAVPVPAAAWLFGSGLAGLIGVSRKRKAG